MSLDGIMVFESASDLKMYKVGDKPSTVKLETSKVTVLEPDMTETPAALFAQWDSIKDRLIPI